MSAEKILKEKIVQQVDYETGELMEQTVEKILKVSKEPNFIKLYLDCMLTFTGTKHIPSNFLMEICRYINYSNKNKKQMYLTLSKRERDEMAKELGISDSMVKRYIRNCIDSGILFKTDYRACFIVNPFLIAKGEWNNIKELRAEFNFTSGTWSYTKGTIADEDET